MARTSLSLSLALCLIASTFALGCASAEAESSATDEGALETPADRGTVRHGVYAYRYRAKDGLIKRLALREDGTFERTEWHKATTRLSTRTTKGTYETYQRQLPAGIAYRLKLKPAGGGEEVYRYAFDADAEIKLMRDADGAPQSDLRMVEGPRGQPALSADCRVTEMHDHTIFEESLSEDEYPDVELYRSPTGAFSEVWIGGSTYSSSDGDRIDVHTTATGLEATITSSGGAEHLVRVEGRAGVVLSKEGGRQIEVATLRCKK